MKTCYLLYTTVKGEPTLLAVYKKSSYQAAYNRLADIAERFEQRTLLKACYNNIAVEIINPSNSQRWWLERWEME